MSKTRIMVKGITETTGRSGKPYFVIETNQGKMSCFPDYAGLQGLKDAWKNDAEIEVNVITSEDGKFKNIKNDDVADNPAPKSKSVNLDNNFTTMYVSYAKDVYIGLNEHKKAEIDPRELMDLSIQLVKQARNAFS